MFGNPEYVIGDLDIEYKYIYFSSYDGARLQATPKMPDINFKCGYRIGLFTGGNLSNLLSLLNERNISQNDVLISVYDTNTISVKFNKEVKNADYQQQMAQYEIDLIVYNKERDLLNELRKLFIEYKELQDEITSFNRDMNLFTDLKKKLIARGAKL